MKRSQAKRIEIKTNVNDTSYLLKMRINIKPKGFSACADDITTASRYNLVSVFTNGLLTYVIFIYCNVPLAVFPWQILL